MIEPLFRRRLGTVPLRHVENVNHLVEIRADLGKADDQTQVVQRAGKAIKQAAAVDRKDFYDGALVGKQRIDTDLVRQIGERGVRLVLFLATFWAL